MARIDRVGTVQPNRGLHRLGRNGRCVLDGSRTKRRVFAAAEQGDAAIPFCFVFLYIAAAGPGPWAINQRYDSGRAVASAKLCVTYNLGLQHLGDGAIFLRIAGEARLENVRGPGGIRTPDQTVMSGQL